MPKTILTANPKHVDGGLVQLDEDAVVDLAQAEQLQDLAHLGGHLQSTIRRVII